VWRERSYQSILRFKFEFSHLMDLLGWAGGNVGHDPARLGLKLLVAVTPQDVTEHFDESVVAQVSASRISLHGLS
jgi:hypothetical protein